jgi:hypothetical protein
MADLVPHPLVTRVGVDLALTNVMPLKKGEDAYKAVGALLAPQPKPAEGEGTSKRVLKADETVIRDDDTAATEKNLVAQTLANHENLPELILVAGYLGAQVKHASKAWRLFYLDSRLESWLLVLEDDIVTHQRLEDDHAPSGSRDVLWIKSTAILVRGSGSGARATDGRFLVGEFTKAGDFAASTTGGTFSAATGLLCEATTPGCCWGARSR